MNFYLEAFSIFFKIGLFTIGGGYAMVPLIQNEVVDRKKWISKEDFIDLLAIAQSAPGVFAVNIAIFIGYKLRKKKGAVVMTLGTVLPSFLIILAIAIFFQQFKEFEIVEKTINLNRYTIWIPIVSALLIYLLDVSPIYIIILSGTLGYLYGRYKRKKLTK